MDKLLIRHMAAPVAKAKRVAVVEAPKVTGTELEIVTPAATEILGPEVDRLATLHTNDRTDRELLAVSLKSHADGSPPTIRVYSRRERILGA